jgi:hypothetical protein
VRSFILIQMTMEPTPILINLKAKRTTSTRVSLNDKTAADISPDGLSRVCLV